MSFGKRAGPPGKSLGDNVTPETTKAESTTRLVFPLRTRSKVENELDRIRQDGTITHRSAPSMKEVSGSEREAQEETPKIKPAKTLSLAQATATLAARTGQKKKNSSPNSSGMDATAASVSVGKMVLDVAAERKFSTAKSTVFAALIESVDLTELGKLGSDRVREEIGEIVTEIMSVRKLVFSAVEQQRLIVEICDDVLGLGPLEPLLMRDDIADIMVNGPNQIYIETDGIIEETDIQFRDNAQVMNICQRIVSAVGRRVDESSPICDARLADGSRVNVIVPPLAIDGPTLTIRKFKKDKLTLDDLVEFGSISPGGAQLLLVIAASRLNVLISGGTGSGKTTLLNCMTRFIDPGERIITCEDAAELQIQQPHVVRLETRPPNLEGAGQVTMRDLVRNCLRMRPERIIVGEVRGPEAFDLLQAMNTGHDGSMGTVHANSPREAINRVENMIAMGGFHMAPKAVREQIASAVTVIIQAQRLRDGSRRITHISELLGMEGDTVTMQDLFTFEIFGEDKNGKIIGQHKATGLRPGFWDRSRYFGLEDLLAEALDTRYAA